MSREDEYNWYIDAIILEARRIIARDDEWLLEEMNPSWGYMPSNLLRLKLSRFDKYMSEKGDGE
jgi:hypothetical protein